MNEYGTATAPDTVRIERSLPGPIERVWAWLTEPDKRAAWLAGGPMELHVGGRVELRFHHAALSEPGDAPPPKYARMASETRHPGRVTACDPPRLLAYTWGSESDDASEVSFELEPSGDRVRLVVTHRRVSGRDEMASVAAGWHTHLGILVARLEGQAPESFWAAHTRLEAEYEQRFPAA